jgi:hypothetical protein
MSEPKPKTIDELIAEQGVKPYDADTFSEGGLSGEETDALIEAIHEGRQCPECAETVREIDRLKEDYQTFARSVHEMADKEVQLPGDNEQRFRALMRIRSFAERHIAEGPATPGQGETPNKSTIGEVIE